MHEKLGSHDHGREKSRGGIKQSHSCLLSDIGEVAEIPGHQIIDFMIRGKCDVDRISHEFAVEYAAGDIAFRKDRHFFRKFKILQRFDYFQVARPVRLVDPLEFALNEDRAVNLIFGQLMFEPANRQIAAKRIAVIQICTDYGRFQIQA